MSIDTTQALLTRLQLQEAVLVTVVSTHGSVPREAGTWMAVFENDVIGTIGGGRLEFEAIAQARALPAGPEHASRPARPRRRYPLGPSLGQCCGGVVELQFERIGAADVPVLAQRLPPRLQPLALFGGGHVGAALVRIASTLPFSITWIDSRDDIFPETLPPNIACEQYDPLHDAVPGLAPQSMVLIMSFSHAEDFDIVRACLERLRARNDLRYIGLIGSRTKWASFRHRLEDRGFAQAELARVICPIGVPGVVGKEPEVIAVAVAAQLLQRRA